MRLQVVYKPTSNTTIAMSLFAYGLYFYHIQVKFEFLIHRPIYTVTLTYGHELSVIPEKAKILDTTLVFSTG